MEVNVWRPTVSGRSDEGWGREGTIGRLNEPDAGCQASYLSRPRDVLITAVVDPSNTFHSAEHLTQAKIFFLF